MDTSDLVHVVLGSVIIGAGVVTTFVFCIKCCCLWHEIESWRKHSLQNDATSAATSAATSVATSAGTSSTVVAVAATNDSTEVVNGGIVDAVVVVEAPPDKEEDLG